MHTTEQRAEDASATTRYTRVMSRDDHIESKVVPSTETVELSAGTEVVVTEPIRMRITLLSATGNNRARLMIEADKEVHLEHVSAKAGMVNRKKPR